MNKSELQEIRKAISGENERFTIENVVKAFVNTDKKIVFREKNLFGTLPPDDQELLFEIFKKSVGGTFGKHIREYEFAEDEARDTLYKTVKSKLGDTDAFLERIVGNIDYIQSFTILSALCSYSIPVVNKNDETTGDYEDYFFVITSICPVSLPDDTLVCDSNRNKIYKRPKTDMLVNAPTDAFLFPVLTGGQPDVNSVLYFSKSPKKPNFSIISDVLGCKTTLTADSEKSAYSSIIEDSIGDDLSYSLITSINKVVDEEIVAHTKDEKPAEYDKDGFCSMLEKAGVDDDIVEKAGKVFEDTVGENSLLASNIATGKTTIDVSGITISVPKAMTNNVRTAVVGGKECLVVDIDGSSILVNGMTVKI